MRVAVLGAGIAGLTSAHAIRREAKRRGEPVAIEIFEAGSRAGGRIHTTSESGFLIEWAANAFRTGVGPTQTLVSELGMEDERVEATAAANRRYLFQGGRLHLLPADPISMLGFGAISPGARARVLAEPFFARRVAREETVHDYAARHIGEEAAHVMLGTLVRGVYAGDSRKLSLDAAFPKMREMERDHRSLVVAAILGRKERKREAKTLWSFARGMGSLMDRIAASFGDALAFKSPALALSRAPDFAAPTPFTVRFANGEAKSYDAVVVATPAREAAALLRDLDRDAANVIREIPAAGVAMVALAFRAETFRTKPDGYGFLVAPGETISILGALFESNIFLGRAPEGYVLVRIILGGVHQPDLLTRSDADLVGIACQALDKSLGLKGGPEKTWIGRQEAAIPQYVLGHNARIEGVAKRLAAFPGLHLAGNAYRGISVGSIVEDADQVAARVVGRRGQSSV
jgi:oxygen-dependent protoporphyrinogen oxidase